MANSNVQLMMAMQNGQFAEVAGILDRCELEVCWQQTQLRGISSQSTRI
jgi:hypothetical protein